MDVTDDKLDRVRVMADKLARVRAAARELESALNDFGPGVDVDVRIVDASTMALIGVLYTVRLQMRRDPLPIYP